MTKNLTSNVLIFIYFIFFIPRVTFILLLCFLHGKGKKHQQENKRGARGPARLDTFGMRKVVYLLEAMY